MYGVLILTMLSFLIFGIFLCKKIINPLSIYNFIWLVVCLLYRLQLSLLQKNLNDKTCKYLVLVDIGFSLTFIISSRLKYNKSSCKDIENINLNNYFAFWLILEIIETIYSGGLPFFWLFTNTTKNYFSYGISSVHGFANALGLCIITVGFYKYLHHKDNKLLLKIIGMLIFYFLLITRQVIMCALLQMFVIYCLNRKKFPYFKALFLSFIIIIGFGLIGNMRTGYEHFLDVSRINQHINPFFAGFYWVYMYLTMTLANLNKLFNLNFTPLGIQYIAYTYIPSALVSLIFKRNFRPPMYLVTNSFTVGGYFMSFYLSNGLKGIIVISIVYGIFSGVIYKKFITNRCAKTTIYYSICLQIILLSFFVNHLFYLPSGFQFVIIMFMFRNTSFVLKRRA